MQALETQKAFDAYESIRHRLPSASFPKNATTLSHVETLFEHVDGFFLDAFGVLNVGTGAIEGAKKFIEALHKAKKPFFILSNSASIPKAYLLAFFHSVGLPFDASQVITSREVLWQVFNPHSKPSWGVIAQQEQALEQTFSHTFAPDEAFWDSDAFLFLGSTTWNETLQKRWIESLHVKAKPIWIANPDITAPRGEGIYSKEPGFYTLLSDDALFQQMSFVGKPFSTIFEHALQRAHQEWGISKERILMVGDTLHTDILGGCAAGVQTMLIEDYGFFANQNVQAFIDQSGIVPHFRLKNYETLFH